MKKWNILIAFLFLSTLGIAQGYFTAGGLRVGDGIGLTVQQRVAKKVTVEGILKTINNNNRNEFTMIGLIERHVPIISRKLNFYVGAGLHKGFNNDNEVDYKNPFGVTGVAGLELSIGKFNVSYDFKPAINLVGGTQKIYPETALSLRYIIVKDKVFKDMAKNKKKKNRAKDREKRKREGKFTLPF